MVLGELDAWHCTMAVADANFTSQSLDLTTNRLRQLEPRLLALPGAFQ